MVSCMEAQEKVEKGSVFILKTYLTELNQKQNKIDKKNQKKIQYNTQPTVAFEIEEIKNDTLYTKHKIGENFALLNFSYDKKNNLYFSIRKMKFSPYGREKKNVSLELVNKNKIILRTYNDLNEIEGVFEYKLTHNSINDHKSRRKNDNFKLF